MPAILDKDLAKKFVTMRHPEYERTRGVSRWLLDTLAADSHYKDGIYGLDRYGQPIRNLLRLPQELPLRDMEGIPLVSTIDTNPFHSMLDQQDLRTASEEMYQTRRERTPIPQFLPMFLEKIMGKIYKQQIKRDGPPELLAWTENIDGRRTSLDEWMRQTVAPVLCALGMLDVAFDHPVIEPNGIDYFGASNDPNGCVARIILPEHILWWIKDPSGFFYEECLIREYLFDGEKNIYIFHYRHWTSTDWTLYNMEGEVISTGVHTYRVVPIVRLYDKKDLRFDDVGRSRFYGIADKSRAYYNEESELILNDTYNNCPLLQGPPDEDNRDDGIPIGRNLVLRKVEDRNGNLNGYEYISMPTQMNNYMIERLTMIQSMMEAEAGLTRAAGATSTSKKGQSSGAVAQSGLSKAYDQQEGEDYLASVSRMLGTNDWAIMFFALIVLNDGAVSEDDIKTIISVYPTRFNLLTFDQIAIISASIQEFKLGPVGQVPTGDKETLKLMYRQLHPDLDSLTIKDIDKEIEEYVDTKSEEWKNKPVPPGLPGGPTGLPGQSGPVGPDGAPLQPSPAPVPGVPKPAPIALTLPTGVKNPIKKA